MDRHGGDDYTARSVAVGVFGEGVTAVNTNARRLLSRCFDTDSDADGVEGAADAIGPAGRDGDFLHAMLDFAAEGSTALPRLPRLSAPTPL